MTNERSHKSSDNKKKKNSAYDSCGCFNEYVPLDLGVLMIIFRSSAPDLSLGVI